MSQFPRLRTAKGQVLAAFVPLLLVAILSEPAPWRVVLEHLGVAVLTACLLDAPYLRVETGRWQIPTSALLTGLIVGMILAPGTGLDIVAVASLVAIVGKRLIRIGDDHLFNPAVLGLLWVGWQFGSGESWWGALANASPLWLPVLLVPGVVIVHRLNKLPLVLTFGAGYAVFWTAISYLPLADSQMAAEMFRPPFLQAGLFLALYMLTDPPTSPNRYLDQVCYGAVAALGSFAATLLGAGQLYLLLGTAVANLWLVARRVLQRLSLNRFNSRPGRYGNQAPMTIRA
jgi:Na+-transporting NADH:ubiquinone oxidoreductase subunit NqrB